MTALGELVSAAATHRDVMVQFARAEDWRTGAELGVGSGHLFERLLEACPELWLIGVDTFVRRDRRQRVKGIAGRHPGRCTLFASTTAAAAPSVSDSSLDFVFVDAGHSYASVRADLRAWWPKVKPGGWFGGHDYHDAFPGVRRAVDERFGASVQVAPHAIWWVRR